MQRVAASELAEPVALQEPADRRVATVSCADLPLCDDFESAAADGPPNAAKWKVGAPNGMGTGTLAVDGTQAHSGTKSVRVTGKANYNNHIFFYNETAVAGIGKLVFGRMFVRFGQALADGHTTFMTMKDTVDMKDLRMGGQMKILMYNRELNDATLPELSPMGIAKSLSPMPNTWICLEFKIDGNTGEIQTWADGNEILGLHADGTPTQDIDGQWVSGKYKPSLSDIKFGWESYAGGDMTLWFDDVALARSASGASEPLASHELEVSRFSGAATVRTSSRPCKLLPTPSEQPLATSEENGDEADFHLVHEAGDEGYCLAVLAPPASDTSLPAAACRACSSAASIPSVAKLKVVPSFES